MQNLRTAQIDNRSRVLLGPHRLDNRINSELAKAYVEQLSEQATSLLVVEPTQETMSLDSLELIELLLQQNRTSFENERRTLPDKYRIENGLLLYSNRLCVQPDSPACTRLIREAHDQVSSAHPSAKKTYQLLSQKYY